MITISTDPDELHDKASAYLTEIHAPVVQALKKTLTAEGRKTNNYRIPQKEFEALADIIAADWSGAVPLTMIIMPGGKIQYSKVGGLEGVELRREIVKAVHAL